MIAEAVSIALKRPSLNVQREFDYVLPSCRKRNVRGEENQAGGGRRQTQAANEGPEGRDLPVRTPSEEPSEGPQEPAHAAQEPVENIRQRLRPRTRMD